MKVSLSTIAESRKRIPTPRIPIPIPETSHGSLSQHPAPDRQHAVGRDCETFDTGPCRLFVKLESQNPGGSIKDRIGRR